MQRVVTSHTLSQRMQNRKLEFQPVSTVSTISGLMHSRCEEKELKDNYKRHKSIK